MAKTLRPMLSMPSLSESMERSSDSMERRRSSGFSTSILGASRSAPTLRDEGLLRAPPARCLDPLHVQKVVLSRSDSTEEPRKDDGVQEEPVLWMEPVLIKEEYHMAVVHADRLVLSYIPAQEPIGAMFRGFRRGPLGGGDALICLPFERVASVERVKKGTSAFVDPALNLTSRALTIKDSDGAETVLVQFQESSRLDLYLRAAWLNHVITRIAYSPVAPDSTCLPEQVRTIGGKRRRTRKGQPPPSLCQSAYGQASAYYNSLEAILLSTKDVRECTQLLEELACACLLDLTLKRLLFRSSRLLPRLFTWIDSFRSQATALAVKGPLENSLALKGDCLQGPAPLSLSGTVGALSLLAASTSPQASMTLLLGRVLACLRLLFAGLYASEGVPERFGPLLGSGSSSPCHVSELVRLLSDDLTDVVRLFELRPEKAVGQRDTGALSLRIDQWLTQRESAISCLHSTGRGTGTANEEIEGPLDAMDLFTTLHDLQVCVLGCVSGLLQAYNLDAEGKGRAPEEGVGTHLAAHARDPTVFLKDLVSRLITLLQALVPPPLPVPVDDDEEDSLHDPDSTHTPGEATSEVVAPREDSKPPACETTGLVVPVPVIAGSQSEPQEAAGAAPPTATPAVSLCATEGGGEGKEPPPQQPPAQEIEEPPKADARMECHTDAGNGGEGQAEAEWEQAAALLLDPPRGMRGFLQTLRQLRRSSSGTTSSSLLTATSRSSLSGSGTRGGEEPKPPRRVQRAESSLSYLLETTATFSLTAADLQEAEARVLGLEALVLHTQPTLSLYWHALLLWHVSRDDYLVREAIRDACHEEIRLYLGPLLATLRKARAACSVALGGAGATEAQQACGGVLIGCCVDLLQAVVQIIHVD